MLNRLHHTSCLECGKPYRAADFSYHYNRPENGPAYWSDRGLLCSHACASAHSKARRDAGDPMREPAENPLERGRARRG